MFRIDPEQLVEIRAFARETQIAEAKDREGECSTRGNHTRRIAFIQYKWQ